MLNAKRPCRNTVLSATVLVLVVGALVACGPEDGPRHASLAQLRDGPMYFDGQRIRTCGTVRGFESPEHYWLEDDELNRVGLPTTPEVAARRGETLWVTGDFSYQPDDGRHFSDVDLEPGSCD